VTIRFRVKSDLKTRMCLAERSNSTAKAKISLKIWNVLTARKLFQGNKQLRIQYNAIAVQPSAEFAIK